MINSTKCNFFVVKRVQTDKLKALTHIRPEIPVVYGPFNVIRKSLMPLL